MDPETERQYQVLLAILRNYSSCLVAYSGGVDSVLLAYAAHRALGDQALAVIAIRRAFRGQSFRMLFILLKNLVSP